MMKSSQMLRYLSAKCMARIGKETCKLPPSAHGIDFSRAGVEVAHSFVMGTTTGKV